MPMGSRLTTKLITLHLVNKRCQILNFWIFYLFFFATITIVQTILMYFCIMNFRFWVPNLLKNEFNYGRRCIWDTLSLQKWWVHSFTYSTFSKKTVFYFFFAKPCMVETILMPFWIVNFTFLFPNWLINDSDFIRRCVRITAS